MRALLLLCAAAALAADNSFLLRNVTVHPVSAPELPNSSVLVTNGRIAGIGARTAPRGVRVIDGKGLHVWPGMIDSATQMGLTEISSVRETSDTTELGDFHPQLRTLHAVNPESEHIFVTRANGITSVLSMPGERLIGGQSAIIHLDGWTWEEMSLQPSAGLHIGFPVVRTLVASGQSGPSRRVPYPEARRTYEEQIQKLRRFFDDARAYQRVKSAAAAEFKTDLKFEAMLPVLEGRLPVVISAVRERAVRDALAFAAQQNVRLVLAEVREPGAALAEIVAKNIPVILGKTFQVPLQEDDPYDAPYTLPAELHKAGVKFAFGSFSTSFARNLPYEAANAVTFGLPHEAALRAVTLNAAEIWGIADRVGSIAEGKLADLVVTDGDLLETRTQIRHVFIEGREISLDNKHIRLYEKYRNRP